MLANVHLKLHVLEPRTNAALRAIGLMDPPLRPRLLGQVWVWISLENSRATVQLVDGMQRFEGQADLSTDSLQTYLNYCIGWGGSALRDIVVSWSETPLSAPLEEGAVNKQFEQAETNRALRAIEEIAVQLDICVHLINPLRPSGGFSEYSGFVRDVAKKLIESEPSRPRTGAPLANEFAANSAVNSMQPDWLVALVLAWGLIDNPRQLDLANMCTDITPKSLSTENVSV